MRKPSAINHHDYDEMMEFLEGECTREADRYLAGDGFLRLSTTGSGAFEDAVDRIKNKLRPEAEQDLESFERKYYPVSADRLIGDPSTAIGEFEGLAMARQCAAVEAAYLFGLAVGRRIGPPPSRAASPVKRSTKRRPASTSVQKSKKQTAKRRAA